MGHQSQPFISANNSFFVECYMFWLLYKPKEGTIIFLVNRVLYTHNT